MTETRGPARWGYWLLEIASAFIVGVAMLGAAASFYRPYSDEDILQSLVDTYEPSAWNVMSVSAAALLGVGCALVARVASRRRMRKQVALLQIALMFVSIGVAAYEHHRLMQRTTVLTGQTFGAFP